MDINQTSPKTKERKITLGLVLSWLLGIFIGVPGIMQLFSKPLVGIALTVAGALLLPPVNKLIKEKLKFSISGGLRVAIVIVLLIIAGSLSAGSSATKSSPNTGNNEEVVKQPEPIIKVTAYDFVSEYKANQVAADNKYKGKTIQITGTINSIGKDILDNPYVTLAGTDFLSGVQCYFDKSDQGQLAALQKDTKLTVECKVNGESIGNIIVRNCAIK